MKTNFGDLKADLKKSGKLIGHFSGLQVSAFGVGFEAQFDKQAKAHELVPSLTEAITKHLRAPLQEFTLMVSLDQLDESWDGSQDKKDLLVGLVKGVKRVNDQFGWSDPPIKGVRVVAFLRTDIYESLAFDDKDKVRDSIIEISWNHAGLSELLQQRLGQVALPSLFDSQTSQKKGRIPKGSFNYLVSRTFMRPRDLLQFLTKLQFAEPNATVVTKALVEAVEPTYSREKVDDLSQEYRRGAPWVDAALGGLKQGPNKYESRMELEGRLAERVSSSDLRSWSMEVSDLVEWMTEASILGAAPRTVKTETIRFRCEGEPVSLEGDSTAWVHPALFKGLALSEPRATR